MLISLFAGLYQIGMNLPGTINDINILIPGSSVGSTDTGNNGASTAATMAPSKSLKGPRSSTILYFATDGCNVRKIDLTSGQVTHVAGSGCGTAGGSGVAATSAVLAKNSQITMDTDGNLYLYETSYTVRKIDFITGIITTIAGQMNVMSDVAPAGQDATAVTLGGMDEFSGISIYGSGKTFTNCL